MGPGTRTDCTEFWNATSTVTASFGLVENAVYHGDGTSIRDTLGRSDGILSGSAQIASAISGAILGGRGYHHIIDGTCLLYTSDAADE